MYNIVGMKFLCLMSLLSWCCQVQGQLLSIPAKPDPDDAAASARCTLSTDLGGAPFGNVVSFSDGLPNEGSGIPYFYLTTLDPTARNALKDEKASFTVSEYPLGTCGRRDPQNPTCSKISLTGKLKLVDEKSKEAKFARNALFSKHPEMKGWPGDHNFQLFKLEIENIFLINWFGGPKPLTVEQYLHPKMNKVGFIL
ncbi:protein CREG1 isoform X2 [Abrus precatorius]|uniref:Protein CREG1 isoform X2 n=1 Tax=Abrus precatorius TaxID=3816 RepID=A0A8B8LA07_ABRPR|nr:protein CREG1 isoform X2 [Abrus precatorius]